MRSIILATALVLAMPVTAGSREDDAIRLNVEGNLRQVQALAGERLYVEVSEGTVRLSGSVSTLYRKWQALDQTSRVRGVLSIQDAIELEGGSRSNSGLLDTVERRLEDIPRVANQKLEISVSDGTVTLKGKVNDARLRFAARDAVADLVGVTAVVDAITSGEQDDETLKKQLTQVLGRSSLDHVPGNIEIAVENGVVTLTGDVPRLWERIDAERTVLGVNGVSGVVNLLELKPKPRPE
jgi:osmotically-inducible protein OsmY